MASFAIMEAMNLEQLSKTQIVLLTLFVSFVTSIATGIVTVTLVEQAPSDVTRTINTVVERTVEKVVPGETRIVERIKEISNPTESDLAIGAIDKTQNVLVIARTSLGTRVKGFFVSNKGEALVMAPAGVDVGNELGLTWIGSGTTTMISVKVKKIDQELGVMIVAPSESQKILYPYVNLSAVPVPALGQRVISIGYSDDLGVKIEFGNVIGILDAKEDEGARRFLTSLSGSNSNIGAPVVDVSARVMGIEVGRGASQSEGSVVIPLSRLSALIGSIAGASTTTPLTN